MASIRGILIAIMFVIMGFGYYTGKNKEILPDDHLPGTKLLSIQQIDSIRPEMLKEVKQYFQNEIELSSKIRASHWQRNYQSDSAYLKSVAENRVKFKTIIGAVDQRENVEKLSLIQSTDQKEIIAETDAYTIYSVRWPVFDCVTGTGLWIEPHGKIKAQVVAIPDADRTPEMLAGLSPGVPPEAQFARKLAEAGCRVIVPVLINRNDTWSGNPEVEMTNETHREFIYRRAYEVGRHIIGFEVQKVLGAVDWFTTQNQLASSDLPIAVAGYGEGGLIAFYSAAIDQRIDGTLVSGYFQEREGVWKEPIYRNIWGLLTEFGDAEIASLIAPRSLVIEACKGPEVAGPPAPTSIHKNVAAPGRLETPPLESVTREAKKANEVFEKLKDPEKIQVVVSDDGTGLPGTNQALQKLLTSIGIKTEIPRSQPAQLKDQRLDFDPENRMHEQFVELLRHLDKIIGECEEKRAEFWSNADSSSIERWEESTESYRNYLWEELIGKMPAPSQPLNPRTRLIYETSKWRGYWVELDVWDGIITGGILLVPKNIQKGEKRPLVVCQHGLGGHPEPLVDTTIKSVYNAFGAKLADQGYVVYAPQSVYGLMPQQSYGKRSFRIIQRMANPLKKSLFSIDIGQNQQTLNWLNTLPFVDGEHMGFYGLSYGGKAAMRVPAVLKNYSVVICAGDFNQWVWKTTSMDFKQSYLFLPEYDMYEFNLGNTINYAEMAGLIAPRSFMVERGHWDPVSKDEWVAYEYAKVRRMYDQFGIGDHTKIEFFNGPHEIHGVGTFQFLNTHLKLPRDSEK